jgi:triphosphoribosyl-dephospho-CoA synthase
MMPIPATSTNNAVLPLICLMLTQRFAWRAMLTEVNLSPKPGLVDRINNGAHKDMALEDFHRSAEAIQAWLPFY